METIIRRLQALTIEHRSVARQRTLGLFGAWQALDDDPVLLGECDDRDCPHDRR